MKELTAKIRVELMKVRNKQEELAEELAEKEVFWEKLLELAEKPQKKLDSA